MDARRYLAAALLVAVVAPVGRSEADNGLRRVAVTKRAVYYAGSPSEVDVKRTEAYLERLEALLASPPAPALEYWRQPSASVIASMYQIEASGVTDLSRGRIDSVRAFHPHELVHAVAGRLGRPPVLFAEGLAVALTSRGRWNGRALDDIARESVGRRRLLDRPLEDFALDTPADDYAVAGSFVAFLLNRFGIGPMRSFLRGCGTHGRFFTQAFADAYGRSVADAEFEWERALQEADAGGTRPWHDERSWPASLERAAQPTAYRHVAADAPAGVERR